MPEPLREQVLAAILTELQGISVGNGYHTTPVVVTRTYRPPETCQEFPTLMLMEGPEPEFERIGMGGSFLHRFTVGVIGVVKGTDQVLRSTLLQRLWADVIQALLSNERLSGLSLKIEPLAKQSNDEGTWDPLGAFAQVFEVTFAETIT